MLKAFGSFTIGKNEAPAAEKLHTYRVGDMVTVIKGKYEGSKAEVIEVSGCIVVLLYVGTKKVEVEIHEDWIAVEESIFYVGGNVGPNRVYFKTSNINEAKIVAGNVSASHSRVTINERKPRGKNKPIYTKADTPHYYEAGKFGAPW